MGVSYKAEVNGALIPLGGVDVIGDTVQVQEGLGVGRIFVQPVPVDLADIFGHTADEFGGHGIFPTGPCRKGWVHRDVAVLFHKSSNGFLVGLVAGLAAPPAHAQGHFAVGGRGAVETAADEAAVVEVPLPPQAASRPAAPAAPAAFRNW